MAEARRRASATVRRKGRPEQCELAFPGVPFPVDENRIAAAERALGRRLPDGLRDRLRQENGGEIEAAGIVWSLHPILDDSDRRRLRRTGTNNMVHETEEARDTFKELFPDGAVAVAGDGGGNYLLLLPDENKPRWWEPRTGHLEPAPTDWSQACADAVPGDE